MMDKKRILIADDHPIFRSGLRTLIDAEASFTVVGEATDGEQALSLITDERPDVAILDYNMPKLNGCER
jgi:DNA-binding NarL/FixJ family response regulator